MVDKRDMTIMHLKICISALDRSIADLVGNLRMSDVSRKLLEPHLDTTLFDFVEAQLAAGEDRIIDRLFEDDIQPYNAFAIVTHAMPDY